jgi:hypothetical protein
MCLIPIPLISKTYTPLLSGTTKYASLFERKSSLDTNLLFSQRIWLLGFMDIYCFLLLYNCYCDGICTFSKTFLNKTRSTSSIIVQLESTSKSKTNIKNLNKSLMAAVITIIITAPILQTFCTSSKPGCRSCYS